MAKPKAGETFEQRYEILADIGTGGTASVFHARQIDVKRDVALKFLHTGTINDDETISRFYREFKLLSRLSHPHIVTVYGMAIDADSEPYAIFEFIKGTNLRETLKSTGAMNWQRVLFIANQISQAMQYAHENGVVHRDLKPDNIMIEKRFEPDYVKLVDFGLSHVTMQIPSVVQKLTSTGKIIGSPSYMSPEQVSGKADERSDIYALGCVMFEMLSGKRLFPGESTVGILFKQANEDPLQHFSAITQEIPAELFNLLASMLSKDPSKRPASMKALTQNIESILDSPGILTSGSKYKPGKTRVPLHINRTAIACALIVVAGLVILLDVQFFQQKQKGKESAENFQKNQKVSAAKRINDLLARGDIYYAADWRFAKAYNILRKSDERKIPFEERIETEHAFAEALYRRGLGKMALELSKQAQSSDKLRSKFRNKTHDEEHLRNRYTELVYARIWNDLGEREKCHAALETISDYTQSGPLDLALQTNDLQIQKKCIERASWDSELRSCAESFRRHNKLRESKAVLEKCIQKRSSFPDIEMRVDLERAANLLACSKRQDCLELLHLIDEEKPENLTYAKELVGSNLADMLAVCGDYKSAINLWIRLHPSKPEEEKRIENKKTEELISNKTNRLDETTCKILAQRALNSADKITSGRILCEIAERGTWNTRFSFGPSAFAILSNESKNSIPNELRTRTLQLYAESLNYTGFPALAIPYFETYLDELKKHGMPEREGSTFRYTESCRDWALLSLSYAYLNIGDTKNSEKVFYELMREPKPEIPAADTFELATSLNKAEILDQLLPFTRSMDECERMLSNCSRHNRFDLAEKCLQQARKCAEQKPEQEVSEKDELLLVQGNKAKLATLETQFYLAKGEQAAAKASIMREYDRFNRKPESYDPGSYADLAFYLEALGFENQAEQVESEFLRHNKNKH